MAEALHDAKPPKDHGTYGRGAPWAWAQCMDAIAAVLAADNPRFDRERFVKACLGEK